MPVFVPGEPIATEEPVVVVEEIREPGRYRFQLVVVDDEGIESEPTVKVVTVGEIPPVRDIAPATPTRPRKRRGTRK